MVEDTIGADPLVDDCEDVTSTLLLEDAVVTLIDSTSEDWDFEDAVPSVVVGELTSVFVAVIVDDWLLEDLLEMVLERLPDEGIVSLLEEMS